jgi:hypothetical protein
MAGKQVMQRDSAEKKRLLALAILKHPESINKALKEVGIPKSTYYNWKSKDPDFCTQLDGLELLKTDFVESALFKKIAEGDTRSIIFYLETKGGYSKKKEVETTHKHKGVIAIEGIPKEEWNSIAELQQKSLGGDNELKTFDMKDAKNGE